MFKNLKVRVKILLLSTVMMVFIAVTSIVGYYYTSSSNANLSSMYNHNLLSILLLENARNEASAIEADTYYIILHTGSGPDQRPKMDDITNRERIFDQKWTAYKNSAPDSYEKQQIPLIDNLLKEYRQDRSDSLKASMEDSDQRTAISRYFPAEGNALQLQSYLEDLASYSSDKASTVNKQNLSDFNTSKLILLAIFLFSILIALFLTYIVSKSISKPLALAVRHLKTLSTGDFSAELPKGLKVRKDEIGNISNSINQMQNTLRDLISEIKLEAKTVRSVVDSVSGNIDVLNTNMED
ncbi:MAG: methyl-accepting chemotaxis protein, partial [Bacillota bacterium]|nr:methyl-accepting chemotaxis protein [Bacillota bacterium]